MDEDEIRRAVERMVQARTVHEEEVAWNFLRPLGIDMVPHLAAAYPTARRAAGRLLLVLRCAAYSRTSDEAFQLGLMALNDRSSAVRLHACGLLAYSLRRTALPALRQAAAHPDADTAREARAAILAIEQQDHNLYYDRDRQEQGALSGES